MISDKKRAARGYYVRAYRHLRDLYPFYRYPAYRPSKTCDKPYINLKKATNHKYTLDLPEWNKAMEIYLDEVWEYLKTGNELELPFKLGYWRMMKKKSLMKDHELSRRLVIDGKIPLGSSIPTVNKATEGYKVFLTWDISRRRGIKFPNKTLLRVRIQKGTYVKLMRGIAKDRSLLYQLNDYLLK